MNVLVIFLALCLYDAEATPFNPVAVKAGLEVVDKAVDVVDKGVDVLQKIDNVLTGKLNAHYEAVEKRPESLIRLGELAAIAKDLKSGTQVTFENLRGFDGLGEYQPPGWRYEVKQPKRTDQPDAQQNRVFAYPMGVGNMLMSGCFGTGYKKGDPCYKNIRFIDRCVSQIDSANFIGVGFDITQTYSSESRKKSVVQRVCSNKATFLGQDVPDNMNAYGIYDYSIRTHSFQSSDAYRSYLAEKSGTTMSSGVFQQVGMEWQKTKSGGASSFLWDVGGGSSSGGGLSVSAGERVSASLQQQMAGQRSQTSNNFLAVLEADVKLYEIALDHSSPDDLSATFVKDFMNLPTSYYLIGGDIKLQDFVLRYGTHYVKSAKFGGKLNIFKSSTANSQTSQQEFSAQAEIEFSSMMSTLYNSFSQSQSSGNFLGIGGKSSSKSRFGVGTKKEDNMASKTSSASGSRYQDRSEFIQTYVDAQGGDPEIAAAIMDFYTPAFKNRFVKWLSTIPQYPKPYDMTFGRIPELFDVSTESLFKEGVPQGGCFGPLESDRENKYYFLQNKTITVGNSSITTIERVYCKYTNDRDKFVEDFKAKRLALERAIAIFMAEGPFSTSSFDIPAGSRGCETETLDYIGETAQQSRSWPEWGDMKKQTFKVLFRLPFNFPLFERNVEFEVRYNDGYWYTKIPGNRFTIDNGCPVAGVSVNRVCVAGLYLRYNNDHGYFTFDTEYYTDKHSYRANITKPFGERFIARAESRDILKHLEKNKVGEVPCNVQWSNAHRIDPQQTTNCIHFSAASKGDIFIMFASIPKDYSTWFYLQMSPTGIAFYRAMEIEKVDTARSSGTLGDESLFETFFVCVSQGNNMDVTIMYGKAPAQREIGMVHASYTFPHSNRDTVSFYTFGSGEEKITVDDVRVVKDVPTDLECAGDGLVKKNGACVLDCDEECQRGCHQAKDPRSCTACKNVLHFYSEQKFMCMPECPSRYEPDERKICNLCKPGHNKTLAGNEKCSKCSPGTVAPRAGMETCDECEKGHVQNQAGQKICSQCSWGHYNPQKGQTICKVCAKSFYQDKRAQSRCLPCEFGHKCSRGGLRHAQPCPRNFYQDVKQQSVCKACVSGTKSNVGSKKCGNNCSKGYYLKTGRGCYKCATGSIAPSAGTDVCQSCPRGKTSNSANTKCEEINECASNPCRNGALCQDRTASYHCVCKPGYKGRNCHIDINECITTRPCKNNGACRNTRGSYSCTCTSGYQGRHCNNERIKFKIIPDGNKMASGWSLARRSDVEKSLGKVKELMNKESCFAIVRMENGVSMHGRCYGYKITTNYRLGYGEKLVMRKPGRCDVVKCYKGTTNAILAKGSKLTSPNGKVTAVMQRDGNLVVFCLGRRVLWRSGTKLNDIRDGLVFQPDGNLVLYKRDGRAVWNSKTNGKDGDHLEMQDDGNLVLYKSVYGADRDAVWATGTGGQC